MQIAFNLNTMLYLLHCRYFILQGSVLTDLGDVKIQDAEYRPTHFPISHLMHLQTKNTCFTSLLSGSVVSVMQMFCCMHPTHDTTQMHGMAWMMDAGGWI